MTKRSISVLAVFILAFTCSSDPADATGRWRQEVNPHKHGHVQGHHHHYFNNRIYTYNYRPYIPGPRSYYRPWYNHHLTMEYSYPYGYPPVYGYPPAYANTPTQNYAPGDGSSATYK